MITLSKDALAAAQAYNKKSNGTVWEHAKLPEPFCEVAPGGKDFVNFVLAFQESRGLTTDGKLGPMTYAALKPKAEAPKPAPTDQQPHSPGVKNSAGQPFKPGVKGSLDGWESMLSICDSKDWTTKNDPDLSPEKIRSLDVMNSCVIHTTGYGPGVERLDKAFGEDAMAIDTAYARHLANNLTYKAHFFVGRTGLLVQMAPLKYMTWHSASGFRDLYAKAKWEATTKVFKGGKAIAVNAKWWHGRFPDLKSPLDLPGFKATNGKRDINRHTWSIDLLAHKGGVGYTDAQMETCARLVTFIHTVYGLALDRKHVVGHEDINPFDRSNSKGGWDPGSQWDWEKFMDRIQALR